MLFRSVMDVRDIALNMYGDMLRFGKFVKHGFMRQDRINAGLIWAFVGYMVYSEIKRKEQADKIEELSEEIEELKNTEGE